MKKNKELSLHEKAIRLIEGGVVEISGHFVRAICVDTPYACNECDMDSACNDPIKSLCEECDEITHRWHILRFVCKKNK